MKRTPTYQELITLTERPELQHLLRAAADYPDSVLTAIGYLLWTLTKYREEKAN